MDATIISIGAELVGGRCVDTNAAWLSNQLSVMGVRIDRHITVGDEVDAIAEVMRSGLARGGLVVATGGLGPTPDDRTREGLARALGRPLVEDAEALGQIEAFFARIERPMRDSNRVQALVPEGCAVLDNPRGTAPGIRYDALGAPLFALPGVPSEMRAMFERHVLPLAEKRAGGSRSMSAELACFGTTEARIGEALADLMAEGRNPQVGTSAADAIITVYISARGADAAEAKRLLDADAAEIGRRLGDACLGEGEGALDPFHRLETGATSFRRLETGATLFHRAETGAHDFTGWKPVPHVPGATLQEAVARLLIDSGETLATAESCTGGMLAARLTEIPGSSGFFIEGVVTYANAAKCKRLGVTSELIEAEGAVSEAVCRAMAATCRRLAESDYALSITGIAGPDGGTAEKPVGLVYVGLADETGVDVRRLLLGDHLTRGEIRDRACKAALNLLRLRLLSRLRDSG